MDEFAVRTFARARDFFKSGLFESLQQISDLLRH